MVCNVSNEDDSLNPEVTEVLSYNILSTNTYEVIHILIIVPKFFGAL
jgi:hypothetical protein